MQEATCVLSDLLSNSGKQNSGKLNKFCFSIFYSSNFEKLRKKI